MFAAARAAAAAPLSPYSGGRSLLRNLAIHLSSWVGKSSGPGVASDLGRKHLSRLLGQGTGGQNGALRIQHKNQYSRRGGQLTINPSGLGE